MPAGGPPVPALGLVARTKPVPAAKFAGTLVSAQRRLQGPGVVVCGRAVLALRLAEPAEADQRVDFPAAVAGRLGHLQRLGVAVGGRTVPALPGADPGGVV